MLRSGLGPLVISGPSGVGKSTLLKKLFAEFPQSYAFSVSHTTRSPRAGEVDGQSYHFVDRPEFERLISEDAFIEHAEFSKNCYGTSRKAVSDVGSSGKRCILDIEAQGVRIFKERAADLNPTYLFISPPSFSALEQRLTGRNTDSKEAVGMRLQMARKEIEYASTGAHDWVIVNDDIDRAYNLLKQIASGNTEGIFSDKLPDGL